jgi:LPS sulfotransferase NodH
MRYTEAQVTSELLDQPEFHGQPTKIFILSTPRSGSYMLCRHMINAGLGVPHEYFNPIIMRQIAPRLGLSPDGLQWRAYSRWDRLGFGRAARAAERDFLAKYIAALIPRRCQHGIFAAKMHFDQYFTVLNNPVGWRLLDGGLFIHLYREDLLRQAVSAYFSFVTGRWGIDDTVTTAPVPQSDLFDVASLQRMLTELAEADREWRLLLAQNGLAAMSISYERLCNDTSGFVAAIARRLGIDPATLRHGYSEGSEPVQDDPSLPSKSEVVRHYLAAVRIIHGGAAESQRLSAGLAPTEDREAAQ